VEWSGIGNVIKIVFVVIIIIIIIIIARYSNTSQPDALFLKFILIKNSTCFGQIYIPSSGVSTLYIQQ